jgi:hypothetical protein
MDKLALAFEEFDKYNRQDPNIFVWEGEKYPQEYFFALKLYKLIKVLDPDASEELLLASRSQHIGRWEIPRDSYPHGREGYLKWRKQLAIYHAEKASAILAKVGFSNAEIEKVKHIILKQKIKVDKDVQTMENALCLVFLKYQYQDFYPKHEPEKIINILKKSILKMDNKGLEYALTIDYSKEGLGYVKEALKRL